MTAPSLLLTALQPFQAARRLPLAGRGTVLHGHGFEARLAAHESSLSPPFAGAESDLLAEQLGRVIAPLDYSLLDDHLDDPDDDRLADLLQASIGLEVVGVSVRSAPERGASQTPDGERRAWHGFRFEAAHRLPNVPPDHKCGRMHGHGFEVVVFSEIEREQSARQVQDTIAAAWRPLERRLQHACLNDLPGLNNPTSEVLAQWIHRELAEALPKIAGITVMETPSAGCHFDGSGWRIWKTMTFDSAVRLARAPTDDARARLHGHTFVARLHLAGDLDRVLGWVHDYGDVKRRFDPVFRSLDHQPLHESPDLADNDPATIARHIGVETRDALPGLSRIDVLDRPGRGALLVLEGGNQDLLVP